MDIITARTSTTKRNSILKQFSLVIRIGVMLGCAAIPEAVSAQNPVVPASLDQILAPNEKRNTPSSTPSVTAVPEDFATVRLAPGYLVQFDVYDVPEMSTTLRVDQAGNIAVPLAGALHVAGHTPTEAQAIIAKALVDGEILKSPQVTLNILQFASDNITVLGEVQAPGRVQLLAPKSLDSVLALAGGETGAAGNDIEIQHTALGITKTQHISYAQTTSPAVLHTVLVNPGDTVYVHRAGLIYILGAVNRPGGYLMVHGGTLNVLQAVSLALGTTQFASTGTLRLVRPLENGTYTEIPVRFNEMSRAEIPPLQLQDKDILYVPTSVAKSIFLNGSALIGSATSAAIYKAP